MDHQVESPSIYRFGVFEVDLHRRELLKHGARIRLQEKPFLLLTELLRRPGELVTREELRQRLWEPGTFVDFDEGVNSAMKRLRGCLGDSAEKPLYVETVSRYGYRFVAPVSVSGPVDRDTPQQTSISDSAPVSPDVQLAQPKAEKTLDRRAWFRGAVICGVLISLAAAYWAWRSRAMSFPADIHSVAVLPLQNLSGDTSQDYFADGISDELTTVLAKLAGPRVISRTSSMQYKNTHKSVPEIARELSVGALIEGSVERSGDRVRVRVQLIEASTDRHLWAEEYDRRLDDVLQLEAELAQDIAQEVQLQLTEKQRQEFARSRTVNPRAFENYLLGRQYWALRTVDSLNRALEYFNRAIQEDPNDARSYAGLAHCYIVMPMLVGSPQEGAFDKAQQAAAKALALDDSLPEAHLANAESLLYHDWKFADAEREFIRALQLNPNYSTAHQWYGEFLGLMGRHDQAIEEARKAIALDPLSAIVHHQAANILRNAGRFDEAIAEYREALRISPSFYISEGEMSLAFWRQGRVADAVEALRRSTPAYGSEQAEVMRIINALPRAYATGGRRAYIRQLMKIHNYFSRPNFYNAREYAQLGEHEAAIRGLNQSFQAHEMEVLWIRTDPDLDPLRSDPRFQQLVRAIGFPS